MTPSLGASLLQFLILVAVIGAGFGMLSWRVAKSARVGLVGLIWVVTSLILGALGAFRITTVLRSIHSPMSGTNPLAFFAMQASFLAVVLAPVAITVVRRRRREMVTSMGRIAASSAGWALVGLLLALIIALALDLANVPFVPGVPRHTRSIPNDTPQSPTDDIARHNTPHRP